MFHSELAILAVGKVGWGVFHTSAKPQLTAEHKGLQLAGCSHRVAVAARSAYRCNVSGTWSAIGIIQ